MEVSFSQPLVVSGLTRCRRHVLEDLRPYVCLQDACTEAGYGFAHRHDWINHTRQRHWIEYICPLDSCTQKFSHPSRFQAHVEAAHTNDKSRYGTSILLSLALVEKVSAANLVCPFCRESQNTAKAHHRHVGRHMEELALFALPLAEDERDSEIDGDDAGSSSARDSLAEDERDSEIDGDDAGSPSARDSLAEDERDFESTVTMWVVPRQEIR